MKLKIICKLCQTSRHCNCIVSNISRKGVHCEPVKYTAIHCISNVGGAQQYIKLYCTVISGSPEEYHYTFCLIKLQRVEKIQNCNALHKAKLSVVHCTRQGDIWLPRGISLYLSLHLTASFCKAQNCTRLHFQLNFQ